MFVGVDLDEWLFEELLLVLDRDAGSVVFTRELKVVIVVVLMETCFNLDSAAHPGDVFTRV